MSKPFLQFAVRILSFGQQFTFSDREGDGCCDWCPETDVRQVELLRRAGRAGLWRCGADERAAVFIFKTKKLDRAIPVIVP